MRVVCSRLLAEDLPRPSHERGRRRHRDGTAGTQLLRLCEYRHGPDQRSLSEKRRGSGPAGTRSIT